MENESKMKYRRGTVNRRLDIGWKMNEKLDKEGRVNIRLKLIQDEKWKQEEKSQLQA